MDHPNDTDEPVPDADKPHVAMLFREVLVMRMLLAVFEDQTARESPNITAVLGESLGRVTDVTERMANCAIHAIMEGPKVLAKAAREAGLGDEIPDVENALYIDVDVIGYLMFRSVRTPSRPNEARMRHEEYFAAYPEIGRMMRIMASTAVDYVREVTRNAIQCESKEQAKAVMDSIKSRSGIRHIGAVH